MSSRARIQSSKRNGARSNGPLTAESRARSSQNSLRHGLRAAPGRVLPGENAEELAAISEAWFKKLQPRDEAEDDLVNDLVNARWMAKRAGRALFEHAKAQIEQADNGEEKRVAAIMRRLLWDRRSGHVCLYALSPNVDGGPGTSRLDSPNDPDEPSELVRELEESLHGCEILIEHWKTLADRVRNDLPLQAHDRLTAIRMLGRQPAACLKDERVCLIYLACFALHTIEGKDAFDDLKSDMNTVELAEFKELVRSRGPLVVDAGNPRLAKEKLLALFDGMLMRLTAKLEVHQQHVAEKKENTSAKLAVDPAVEIDRLRRYEDACQRRVTRCEAAYWKHRREVANAGLDYRETEGDSVAEAVGAPEVPLAAEKNVTNEPRAAIDDAETEGLQEVARIDKELAQAMEELQRMRDAGIGPFMGLDGSGADGKAALAAAIFGRGPLLPPVT
jgi:hypothetical protein